MISSPRINNWFLQKYKFLITNRNIIFSFIFAFLVGLGVGLAFYFIPKIENFKNTKKSIDKERAAYEKGIRDEDRYSESQIQELMNIWDTNSSMSITKNPNTETKFGCPLY
jgi:hypothetical protein